MTNQELLTIVQAKLQKKSLFSLFSNTLDPKKQFLLLMIGVLQANQYNVLNQAKEFIFAILDRMNLNNIKIALTSHRIQTIISQLLVITTNEVNTSLIREYLIQNRDKKNTELEYVCIEQKKSAEQATAIAKQLENPDRYVYELPDWCAVLKAGQQSMSNKMNSLKVRHTELAAQICVMDKWVESISQSVSRNNRPSH